MPTIPFSKPCLSFDAQYNKLALSIIDKDYVLAELLMHSSYYRIKNYLPPLQAKYQNSLIPVQEVKNLIDFDSTLRTLIFRCIEPIEVYFRSTISEYMLEASHGDSFWYLNTQYFVDIGTHCNALKIIKKDFSHSNESFTRTYRKKLHTSHTYSST